MTDKPLPREMGEYVHPVDCFVCGTTNPLSLGMTFEPRLDGVTTWCRVPRVGHGYPGLAHGGVIAAILDETMGALAGIGTSSRLTKQMSVRFLRPVQTEMDLVAEATLVDRDERSFRMHGSLRHAGDDVVRAAASAEFVLSRPRTMR